MPTPAFTLFGFDSWARGVAPSGSKSKWHLLLDVRRFSGSATHRGRYSQINPGQLFGATVCGQALPDPEWGTAVDSQSRQWAGMTRPVDLPGRGEVCMLCAEALMRQLDSVPA